MRRQQQRWHPIGKTKHQPICLGIPPLKVGVLTFTPL